MGITMKVRNKDRLARKLRELAPETQANLDQANVQSATEMVATAKGFVSVESGTLQNSIEWEHVGGETGAVRVVAGGAATTKPVRSGTDASYDYALGQEFGTEDMPAAPFFFPSYRLVGRKHRGRVTRAINKAIKKVAGS